MHLIGPATNAIVAEITGVEVIHGVAAAPDGSRLYLSNESTHALDIVDTKTLEVRKSIPLSGRPNNVAIHANGERLYVAIRGVGGGVDIIDTVAEEHVDFIRILRGVHNTFMTPDSRYVVAGSIGGSSATVIDTELEGRCGRTTSRAACDRSPSTRTPTGRRRTCTCRSRTCTGSRSSTGEKRREVRRIVQPDIPVAERNTYGIQGAPAHGIKITPDGTTLWSTSKINGSVYAYSLPDLEPLGGVKVGVVPDWLTFTPDSQYLYVANAHSNTVSVVDVAAREEVEVIQVGQVPKRNITARLPGLPVGQ